MGRSNVTYPVRVRVKSEQLGSWVETDFISHSRFTDFQLAYWRIFPAEGWRICGTRSRLARPPHVHILLSHQPTTSSRTRSLLLFWPTSYITNQYIVYTFSDLDIYYPSLPHLFVGPNLAPTYFPNLFPACYIFLHSIALFLKYALLPTTTHCPTLCGTKLSHLGIWCPLSSRGGRGHVITVMRR